MTKKGLVGTVLAFILVIALAITLVATYFILNHYIVLGWQFFPKNEAVMDLTDRKISTEVFDSLAWQLPGSEITWNVPFQGGYVVSDSEEVTLTQLSDSDLDILEYLPQLKTVHAEQCTNYPQLLALYERFPDVDVIYNVPVSGTYYSSQDTTVTLTSFNQEDVVNLTYLPNLKNVDGTQCKEFEALRQLKKLKPEWNVTYQTSIAGEEINPSATTLNVTGATYEELSTGIAAMPMLRSVNVHSPKSDGASMLKLREEYPDVDIHWDVEVFNKTYRDDTEELDLSESFIGSIDNAKEIASKFPSLKKLIVESKGIDNEEMAAYREEMRDSYKVVWTVYFSKKCKARTDETYFMPIKQGEYYFEEKNVGPLRYCEDMICIDIGHSTVKTVEFASYMPHLKYLILAWTQVTDITPLSNCKELVYLEVDHGIVHDFTPLLGCTALEDININDQMWDVDITPLTQMTWLKNLWVTDRKAADKQLLVDSLPNTRVQTYEISSLTGNGWRNLPNYYAMRDCLGMYYMR